MNVLPLKFFRKLCVKSVHRSCLLYTSHVDADTLAGTAEIKVNGKTKATVDITAKVFDGVKITFAPDKDAVMWFDDVNVYNLIDHADYPSYPQVAESTDYNIGLNAVSYTHLYSVNNRYRLYQIYGIQ